MPFELPMAADVTEPTVEEFGAWVEPHLVAMANLAARFVGAADRDDVVQESLTRAWRRWATYRADRGTPHVWLLAIVADRARRHTRGRGAVVVGRIPEVASAYPDVDLEAAIQRLSRRQRLAVELHYFADLRVSDVAQVMHCSEGTVKSTLSDARDRLRRQLEDT